SPTRDDGKQPRAAIVQKRGAQLSCSAATYGPKQCPRRRPRLWISLCHPLRASSMDPAGLTRQLSMSLRPSLTLAVLFLVLFVSGGARFAIGLTFKPMVVELGWSRGELGLAVGVYFLVSALAMYVAGRLADRTSPRLLLNIGVIGSGLGIGLMMLISEPEHALLLYGILFGVGSGFASLTPIGVMVTRVYPGRTGFANAAVISGASAGQLL